MTCAQIQAAPEVDDASDNLPTPRRRLMFLTPIEYPTMTSADPVSAPVPRATPTPACPALQHAGPNLGGMSREIPYGSGLRIKPAEVSLTSLAIKRSDTTH